MNNKLLKAFQDYETALRKTYKAIGRIEELEPRFKDLVDTNNRWELRMHLNHNNFITHTEAIAIANNILKDNGQPTL